MGATPEPSRPNSFWSFSLHTRAKQSEPRPLPVGSTRGRVVAMAMAASMALPPDFRISRPTWEAMGEVEQAMPFLA